MLYQNDEPTEVVESELSIVLPSAQAFITGLAMDRNGDDVLIDAVSIPKEKARQAFEIEATKKVERKQAALAEVSQGNIFRTRISSIRRNGGTKLIRIKFISPLSILPGRQHLTYGYEVAEFLQSRHSGSAFVLGITVLTSVNHTVRVEVTLPSAAISLSPTTTTTLDSPFTQIGQHSASDEHLACHEYSWSSFTSIQPSNLRVEVKQGEKLRQPVPSLLAEPFVRDTDLIQATTSAEVVNSSQSASIAVLARIPFDLIQDSFGRLRSLSLSTSSTSLTSNRNPTRIGVFWDISLSRSPRKSLSSREARQMEVAILRTLIDALRANPPAHFAQVHYVDIYYFNHTVNPQPTTLSLADEFLVRSGSITFFISLSLT